MATPLPPQQPPPTPGPRRPFTAFASHAVLAASIMALLVAVAGGVLSGQSSGGAPEAAKHQLTPPRAVNPFPGAAGAAACVSLRVCLRDRLARPPGRHPRPRPSTP